MVGYQNRLCRQFQCYNSTFRVSHNSMINLFLGKAALSLPFEGNGQFSWRKALVQENYKDSELRPLAP
jgi:hypothetical protein